MKLTCLRGYSGSGKSTKAAEIAKETGAVIVNRDQIRKMLLGSWWTGKKDDEDRVTIAEEAQVTALLKAGVSAVVDATHLDPRYLRKWARLATRLGVDFDVVDVHADPGECKRRVYDRWQHEMGTDSARYLDPQVIDQQVKRFPVEKWPTITAESFVVEPVERVEGLPEAIIVDIDGTLAHICDGGRSPYDYARVSEDLFDDTIGELVTDWVEHGENRYVLIVSGRDSCYRETLAWLDLHGVPYWDLLMRPPHARDQYGGKLPDYRVKYDLFNRYIRGNFNVRFVLDDRLQVCEMWHKLGLTVLRVGDPNANF
jgi:predicted kinase